jgi:catechol 2,3-dioxygenase-like lactoylglutathione lyase family enzyme
MNITKIQLLSVPVSDQDRARDFYVNTLGLELVRDNPMGEDTRWVEVAPKGAETSITLVTWIPAMPPGTHQGLILQTTDIDGDCERLRQAGVAVDGPADVPWGRQATFTDPDGNGFVLSSPPPEGI